MSRSSLHSRLSRVARLARFCDTHRCSISEGLERAAEAEAAAFSRRAFLRETGRLTLGGAAASLAWIHGARAAPKQPAAPRIAIVGGGLAGLTCADRLQSQGILATVYEAGARVGGRCHSLRGFFPGQTAERGGEFIDTLHKTMLAYAGEFKLPLEDLSKNPGHEAFYFSGRHYSEAEVVEQYRVLVPRIRADMQLSTGAPTFFSHNEADAALDRTDLESYMATRAADLPLIRAALTEAHVAEYGLEPWQQSCLNVLLFIHLDRRSRFLPFGVFSDERYHLVGGNDAIPSAIRARLRGPVELGMALERLSRNASGEYELKFRGSKAVRRADAVVLAIPFSVLRGVELDRSLALSADKLRAIRELGYGNNAKTMVGFNGRPWLTRHGSSGAAYSDLPEVQNTWETNPINAGATSVLTDYASGERGRMLNRRTVETQVDAFLSDLDRVYPGARAAATRSSGSYRAFREHWPSNPLALGSYTCYRPGQFTGLAGLEGQAAGALKFAGEHADSFYSWQGFMEGACLSGIRAANEVLADIKAGAL